MATIIVIIIVIIVIIIAVIVVIMIAVVQTKQQLDTKRHFHCFSPELNPLSLSSCCHSCSNEKILFFQHCDNSMHLADRTRDLHHITLSKKYDAAPPLAFHSDWFEHIYHQHLLTIMDLSLMSQGFFLFLLVL